MIKLKPCPFCGADALRGYQSMLAKSFVMCSNKDCKVHPITMLDHDVNVVVAAWNKRADMWNYEEGKCDYCEKTCAEWDEMMNKEWEEDDDG